MGILFCYIIIASIDFGAGFFALHSKMTGNEKKVNHLIHRYLNPVWEVTNVFSFSFVGFIGFPDSAKYLGTVLLVPGSIALILISIRSSFMLLKIMVKILNCPGLYYMV